MIEKIHLVKARKLTMTYIGFDRKFEEDMQAIIQLMELNILTNRVINNVKTKD